MSIKLSLFALMICLNVAARAVAQSHNPPRYEVGAEFITLNRDDFAGVRTELGFGGRFTFNLNRNVALEGAGYFFPRNCFDCANNGRITEAVGGVKAGKRFKTWGFFAKARPGIVSFSKGRFNVLPTGSSSAFPFQIEVESLTNFAADLGAVLEFYPSRRIVTRFDAGDTIIHIRQQTRNAIQFIPATNTFFI